MRHGAIVLLGGAAVGAAALGLLTGARELGGEQGELRGNALVAFGASKFSDPSDADAGLGPGFNATSCVSCHSIPAAGGSGIAATVRFARHDDGHEHAYEGSTVVHRFSTGGCAPVIPDGANVFSHRIPTSTFGSGLVEDIPDEALISLEDPGDRDGDGVSGRAARIQDRATGAARIGRFGWKAQHATLLSFSAEAYAVEMGITSELYRDDAVAGLSAEQLSKCEDVFDPEDGRDTIGIRSIDGLAAFMRSLPPPAAESSSHPGGLLFTAAGCAACHRPQVGNARAYSDFLLHDIGTGDGIREGDAAREEMRTAPLWGIRNRTVYLHDGSARSIDAAVARHEGEAASARQRFQALAPKQQQQFIAFVNSR
jgi:CxxC motif-containing protein (DUF1111 family)